MIGRVVGSYEIVERIGEGGMGTVWRAVDPMLEREVAIKAIRADLAREPQIVERFRSEAKAIARVSHPAITTIYSFFRDGEEWFIAMELVRGWSLAERLRAEGALPWPQAVALLASALEGIEQVHRLGIVHRDLKPDNLMLPEAGGIKVMDFGIARITGSGHLTRTGLLVGTLRYMAPEQIRGEEVDRRADLYALGTVLYEMLTGRVPFTGESDYAVLKAHLEVPPTPPRTLVPDLPGWLDRAVLRALAKETAERFQSAAELRDFLLAPEEDRTIVRPPAASGPPLPGPAGAIPSVPTMAAATRETPPTQATPTQETPRREAQPSIAPVAGPIGATAGAGSYRPVTLGPGGKRTSPGTWVALAAVLAVLGIGAAGWTLWSRGGTGSDPAESVSATAQPPVPAASQQPLESSPPLGTPPIAGTQIPAPPPAISVPGRTSGGPAAGTPDEPRSQEPAARARPREAVAAPAARPTREPLAGNAPRDEPAAASEGPAPEPSTAALEPEAASPSSIVPRPVAELSRAAGELVAATDRLVDAYEQYTEQKEDGGAELSAADQALAQEIERLQEATARFRGRLRDGPLARTRSRLRREDAVARKADLDRRLRELQAAAGQVDRRIAEVAPGPPLAEAWRDVRERGRRLAEAVPRGPGRVGPP